MATKINVNGPIISSDEQWIYNYFGIDATSSKSIENSLNMAKGDELEVLINSPGGYVDEGSAIYTMLKDYESNVTIKIVGMAASAASVIAMAGDKIMISPTARLMIHNASGGVCGDYRDMTHSAQVLKDCNEAISNAYALKTGMKKEDLLNLMDETTFMNATKAKELGFVDEIMFDTSNKLTNSIDSGMISKIVLEKMRNAGPESFKNKDTNPPIIVVPNENNENNKVKIVENEEENELNMLKAKLELKSKCVSSFLLCTNERMI